MSLDETIPEDGDGSTSGTKISELAGAIRALRATLNDGELNDLGADDDIDFHNSKGINLADPTADQDAETKKHVADNYISKVGEQAIKGWIQFNGTGTIAIQDSHNVDSITDNGTGDYTVTWDTDFANDDYSAVVSSGQAFHQLYWDAPMAVGSLRITIYDSAHNLADEAYIAVIAIGDQS